MDEHKNPIIVHDVEQMNRMNIKSNEAHIYYNRKKWNVVSRTVVVETAQRVPLSLTWVAVLRWHEILIYGRTFNGH